MPPKTQSFALPLQKRDSPDKCMEHLYVPSWSEAWEPLNWVMVDSTTCLVNGVKALGGFSVLSLLWFGECWWYRTQRPAGLHNLNVKSHWCSTVSTMHFQTKRRSEISQMIFSKASAVISVSVIPNLIAL